MGLGIGALTTTVALPIAITIKVSIGVGTVLRMSEAHFGLTDSLVYCCHSCFYRY